MIKVYLPSDFKLDDGKFYRTFEVPEGLPLGQGVLLSGPTDDLIYPKYNLQKGIWEEDTNSIITYLKQRIDELEKSAKTEA